MLLVDGVKSLEPGNAIVAVKCVTGSEFCYANLPEQVDNQTLRYPPSLIVESFGQAGALLWLQSSSLLSNETVLLFTSLRNCTFGQDVFPGDTMEHHVRVERVIGDNVLLGGETRVRQHVVMEVEWLMLASRPASTQKL